MNDSKETPFAFAIRLPSEPGWYALALEHGPDGKPVMIDEIRGRVISVAVVAWGFVIDCEPMGMLFAVVLGGNSSNVRAHPLGPDGQRVMQMKGYLGLQRPDETTQEAVDRIEAPAKAAMEERRKREETRKTF